MKKIELTEYEFSLLVALTLWQAADGIYDIIVELYEESAIEQDEDSGWEMYERIRNVLGDFSLDAYKFFCRADDNYRDRQDPTTERDNYITDYLNEEIKKFLDASKSRFLSYPKGEIVRAKDLIERHRKRLGE